MRSLFMIANLLLVAVAIAATTSTSTSTQSIIPTAAPPPDAIPFTASQVQTSAVLDLLSAVGVPTPATVAPSQITALNSLFSAIEVSFFTNSIFAVVPSTLVVSPTGLPALSSSIVSILDGALASHNPSALPTLESLVSGQPFSSNLIAQASAAFDVIEAEKSTVAEAVIEELNMTLMQNTTGGEGGTGLTGFNSGSGIGRGVGATRGLVGATIGVAAGVLGIALL